MKFEIDSNEWAMEEASFLYTQLEINGREKSEGHEDEGTTLPGGESAHAASTLSSECNCSSSHPIECSPGINSLHPITTCSDEYEPLDAGVNTSATCPTLLGDTVLPSPPETTYSGKVETQGSSTQDKESIDIVVAGPESESRNTPSYSDKTTGHIAQQIERCCGVQNMLHLSECQHALWYEIVGDWSDDIDLQLLESLVDIPEPVQSSPLSAADIKQLQRKKFGRTRPMSAYNLFFKQERAKIVGTYETFGRTSEQEKKKRRKYPHNKISFAELGRIIGRRWKRLSKEERAVYEADAEADKKQFEAEKALLLAQL